jgi:hypothetical protein
MQDLHVSDKTLVETETETDVPTVKTAAGAPEGDVVFDHPPSQSEIKESRESIDKARASVDSTPK